MHNIVEQIKALKRAGRRRVQIYEALVMEQEAGKTSSTGIAVAEQKQGQRGLFDKADNRRPPCAEKSNG